MKKENITNPTPEQIKEWEKKYGKVKTLEIEVGYKTTDGEEFDELEDAEEHAADLTEDEREITPIVTKAFLKRPSRKVIAMATAVGGKDPIRFGELILENCWLGGDEKIKTDDDLFLSANTVLGDLIQIKTAKLKN